jgi:hypothetical protein
MDKHLRRHIFGGNTALAGMLCDAIHTIYCSGSALLLRPESCHQQAWLSGPLREPPERAALFELPIPPFVA